MTSLCIQVHPDRAPDLDLAVLVSRAENFVADLPFVTRFAVVEGPGYRNLMFETTNARLLWERVATTLLTSDAAGRSLRQSSMVVCEGERGWDDYLLLHHFDVTVPLGSLI